jgi:hypothetical protein
MELLSLPKETIVDILLLLPPKSLIKFLSINRNLRSEVLSDPRLSQRYQSIIRRRNELITNFIPITLRYFRIIKELFPDKWSLLSQLKKHQNYILVDNLANRTSLIFSGVIVTLKYSFNVSKYTLVLVTDLEINDLYYHGQSLYALYRYPRVDIFNPLEELRESQVKSIVKNISEFTGIYLNKSQINLVTDDIFDYI